VTGKPRPPRSDEDSQDTEAQRFIRALIARGEAARAVDGELPEGATHEIIEDEAGRITVVRRRFVG
jgi:hypothetical protein